jgi:nucleoside-triphosphatase
MTADGAEAALVAAAIDLAAARTDHAALAEKLVRLGGPPPELAGARKRDVRPLHHGLGPKIAPASSVRILLEGRPGSGKTTVARRLADLLTSEGVPVRGFVTEEVRESGHRVGFAVEALGGERTLLAHVDFAGPPRVGKYGVDLEAFERLALPALTNLAGNELVLIDELGKMELASKPFRGAVSKLFDRSAPIVATVHSAMHPFTDALKHRADVEIVRVSERNRDALPEQLAARLGY